MKYNIRYATLSDTKIVNEFLTRLIKDEKQYDENINEKCTVFSLYENLILNENNCILVAESNNNLVGYLYGYMQDTGDAYLFPIAQLEAMFVDETIRKQGVGNALIKEFKKWATNKKAKYIELKVCNDNKSAIALYTNNGFTNVKSIMSVELKEGENKNEII